MELKEVFYDYRDKIYGFFVLNLSDQDLAKDLTQEVFFQLCKKGPALDQIDNLNSYIFLMCRNMAINHLNKAAHEKKYKERILHAWNNLPIRAKSDIDEKINAEYYQEILAESLSQLPPQQKLIFTLSKVEGRSIKKIAQELDLSPNTVRNHLYQAVKSLKANLTQSDIDFVTIALICHLWIQ